MTGAATADRCGMPLAGEPTQEAGAADLAARLRVAEDRLATVLSATGTYPYTAIIHADDRADGSLSAAAYERLIGGPVPDGVKPDEGWRQRIHPDDRGALIADRAALRRGEPQRLEYRVLGADGEVVWVVEHMDPRSFDGDALVVDGIIIDVTVQRLLERRLREALVDARREMSEAEARSLVDPLTLIPNRRHLETSLTEQFDDGRHGAGLGLLLIDVDYFKLVNDTYGHRAGDAVLAEIARRLCAATGSRMLVARWGGEEFCVMAPGVRDERDLRAAGETLRAAIAAEPIVIDDGQQHLLTVSVGGALATLGETPNELIDAADRALYAAKRRGRNQVRLGSDVQAGDLGAHEPESIRIAQAMALSVAVREGTDPLHSQQVADLAASVAQQIGLPIAAVARCRLGGWLHDVGKVGIPDEILKKPGPLDERQWAIVRKHPLIGEQLVRRVAGFVDVTSIIRHHHEWWDGSGYPDGLAGEQIPLEARIVAAANAYAAMAADRVYARGRSQRGVIRELRRMAGSQLDPAVVAALERTITTDKARNARALRQRRRAA